MTRASLSFAVGLALLAAFLVSDSDAALNAAPDDGDFVGDSTCIACHEARSKGFRERFAKTAHARAHVDAGKPEGRSCESCHGPGRVHFEANGEVVGGLLDFRDASPAESNPVCFECHAEVADPWPVSVHALEELSCSSCHTIMSAASESGQLKAATQAETCGECHTIQNLAGEFHQRVGGEGQMECSACHPPHVKPPELDLDGPPSYVGDSVCNECHEILEPGFTSQYAHTLHARVLNETNAQNERAAFGCESCHGPGEAHVRVGGGRLVGGLVPFHLDTPETVSKVNQTCLGCHKGGDRTYWAASAHDSRDLACTSCHTVMEAVSDANLLSHETEVATCASCHQVQHARIFRNAHMPLRDGAFQVSTATEGKMSCGSCHQPHGSVTENLITHISVNDQCLSCHAEKRGPFLWEHSPVPENCLNCHDPHGSTRRGMLNMNVIRLCQSCHVSTGHATNPRDPNDRFAVGSSCLQCHTQVHGSNHPSGFFLTR